MCVFSHFLFSLSVFFPRMSKLWEKRVYTLPLCIIPIRKGKQGSERASLLACSCCTTQIFTFTPFNERLVIESKRKSNTPSMLPTTPTAVTLSICHCGQGEKTAVWNWKYVFFCTNKFAITESSCLMQNTQSKHAIKPCEFIEQPTIHVRRVIKNVAELDNLRVIFRSKRTEQTWL